MVCKQCEIKLAKLGSEQVWKDTSKSKPIPSTNKLLSGNKYVIRKCKLCPASTIQSPHATYCQSCSYKNGICSICGTKTVDLSIHRQRDI